jgi:predicted O-methyltransferase YrrM
LEKLEWVTREAAPRLGLPGNLNGYFREDDREGGKLRGFPGGSIWEIEGIFLYGIARAVRATVIIETGTYRGCSTRHLRLAVSRNGVGRIYSVDINPVPCEAFESDEWVTPVQSDSVVWLEANPGLVRQCSLFFHDSDHSPEHVQREIRAIWDNLPQGAIVVCHDVCSPAHNPASGRGTWGAFRDAVRGPAYRLDFHPLSDCGLGIARKI